MKSKDTTVGQLIRKLEKLPSKSIVRVSVIHDLDCELVKQGPIFNVKNENGNVVILECADDCNHGFGSVLRDNK